jgi:hypothetical protein
MALTLLRLAGTNVLGHAKTILILTIGWLQHKANPTIVMWRQYLGAVLAVIGLLAYNHEKQVSGKQIATSTACSTKQADAVEIELMASVLNKPDSGEQSSDTCNVIGMANGIEHAEKTSVKLQSNTVS